MDILNGMGVSKLSAKVFFFFLKWTIPLNGFHFAYGLYCSTASYSQTNYKV